MMIKNDPRRYLKRSDLPPRPKKKASGEKSLASQKREAEFLSAPIDNYGYLDFGKSE